jgi:fimbrial isopeptide formation D2 family protein/LPXTG-motif cell wall-anchored protein
MILSLSISVLADEPETVTLTITGATGHTYTLYQIFTGDVAKEGDKDVLSNVKYGEHYHPDGQQDKDVPPEVLKTIVESNDPQDLLDAALRVSNITKAPNNDETTVVFSGLTPGYYLIKDTSPSLPVGQTISPIMLQILETTTIASKHATIVSEKKVDDKNDSTTAEDEVFWQDVADYDIGDPVPFQLSVTLPSTLGTYDNYELTFHDKQAAGFSAPTITAVYILKADNTKIIINEGGYTLHNSCPTTTAEGTTCEFGGCSFAVTVDNIEGYYTDATYSEDDKLIVEYTSVLTDAANVGKTGNENSMYVCHPDGHTLVDTVTVLTYQLTINKIDGANQQALEGAGFTLYKKDSVTGLYNPVAVGIDVDGNPIYERVGGGMTTFTWSGIDGGDYKLEETTTPQGYNTIADILFTVDANHKVEWTAGFNAAFLDLIAKDANGTIVFADGATVNGELVEDGILESNVENFKGAVLPETGAEGTFFLITGSTLLVLVAAVFMITRKKMSIYED